MPKSVSQECKKFVLQYAELVIELIVQEVEPKEICTALNLCGSASLMMQSM
jgi:saposin